MTSASNFTNPYSANVIGLWDFLSGAETKDTGLADGIAQDGFNFGGAFYGGWLKTDGKNDHFDVHGDDDPFDLSAGTVITQFKMTGDIGKCESYATVVSRGEAADAGKEGFFEIRVTKNGAIEAVHQDGGATSVLATGPNFADTGDNLRVTYSWDAATGASVLVENLSDGTSLTASNDVTGLTFDLTDNDGQSFTLAAQETDDGSYGRFFEGKIDYLAVLDDAVLVAGDLDGIVEGTNKDDLIDIDYDGDPEGDRIDNGDAVLPGQGPDDDIVVAGAGNDTVEAGAGDDLVFGGTGNDTVYGEDGNDVIYGNSGADELHGGIGDDVIYGDGQGAGEDNFEDRSQDISNVVVYFDRDGDGETDYSVKVDDFPDGASSKFISNDLDDYFDQLLGYVYSENPDLYGTAVTAGVSIKGGIEETRYYAVEGNENGPAPDVGPILNTGPGVDQVLSYNDFFKSFDPAGAPGGAAYSFDDTIFGGTGDDEIYGGAGDDNIDGGEGSDDVSGGTGDDYIYTGSGQGLPDRGFPAYDGYPAVPADPDPFDDRDTVDGGDGNDTILTGDDEDIIDGGRGNDTIDGGLDDDTIDGGKGDDFIIGGEGSDDIDGGKGDDTIYGGLGPALPDALNIRDDGSDGPADPLTDNGMDVIRGGQGDDTIFGQDDDDTLYGDGGEDTIDGGIDDDTIFGGDNDDTLYGGQGNDAIDGGAGKDDMYGGADRDTFTNITADDYVDGNEEFSLTAADDYDTLDLRGSAENENPGGSLDIEYDPTNAENGVVTYFDKDGNATGTVEFYNIENVIPCFTPGTLIATPQGERRVEDLEIGDRVITRDNGIQEIRWLGQTTLTGGDLLQAQHLKPVMIGKGALGNGLPERDMMVSPNHRVLIANDRTALYFDETEVLVAAKHLRELDGVDVVDADQVTYIHFMFDQHEVVLSDGAWTESFQPGDLSLRGVGQDQRREIFELFPELQTRQGLDGYQSARRSLRKHEARLLVH